MIKDFSLYLLVFISTLLLFFNDNYEKIYDRIFNSVNFVYNGSEKFDTNIELTLVFISSSTCVFSSDDALPKIIEETKEAVKEKAISLDYNFSVVGVSTDLTVQPGIDHLTKFGFFDEIITGNSWSNAGALRYIYDDIKGIAVTPQILVTKKIFDTQDEKNMHHSGVKKEVQILRKVGLDEIKMWYEIGLPLPTDIPNQ